MSFLKRIVLDVLKPHQPTILEFASTIADLHINSRVKITVTEVDEKTETTVMIIEGDDLPYSAIEETINSLGASIHSIDEVDVSNNITNNIANTIANNVAYNMSDNMPNKEPEKEFNKESQYKEADTETNVRKKT
ncbi:MAG: DUF211 domain-containing protein [Gammaproteobacteria bacterium]|nr:DUF211 domain-containing protein [Gammaproteobacteria bacterium]